MNDQPSPLLLLSSLPESATTIDKHLAILSWLRDIDSNSSPSEFSASTGPSTRFQHSVNELLNTDGATIPPTSKDEQSCSSSHAGSSDSWNKGVVSCHDTEATSEADLTSPAEICDPAMYDEIRHVADTQNILVAIEIIMIFQLQRDMFRLKYGQRHLAKAQSDIRNVQKEAQRVRDLARQCGMDSVYNDITSRRRRLFLASPLYKMASPFVDDYRVLLKKFAKTTESP